MQEDNPCRSVVGHFFRIIVLDFNLTGIMCSLCTPRLICQSTYPLTVGRHIDHCSTNMLVDILTDSRPMCRSKCVVQDILADISTYTRPICRSICSLTHLDIYIGRYVDRYIDRYVGRHVDRHIGQGVHKLHMIQLLYQHYCHLWC